MNEPELKEIGTLPLGICRFCRAKLYASTKTCLARQVPPRASDSPPCPVEDGALAAEIKAVADSQRVYPRHSIDLQPR